MKCKNEKGFTLVELLVVVIIIGILAIVAIPSVNSIKSKNEKKKYKKYQESVEVAGELFSDSYHEDLFGITGDGCYDVPYQELAKKNLVKDFKTSGISCNTSNTFVHIERNNGKYTYKTSIMCVDESGKVVYKDIKEKCRPREIEDLGHPVITASAKHLDSKEFNWSRQKDITIKVKAGLGLNANATISYGFSKEYGVKPAKAEMTNYRYVNKYGTKNVSYTFRDDSNFDGTKKNGQYYLYVSGIDTLDTGAHHAEDYWLGPLNYDNENPSAPQINNSFNDIWVGDNIVKNNGYKFNITAHDNPSGVSYYQYKFIDSDKSKERIWSTYEGLTGDSITILPLKKERNHTMAIRACDKANNCGEYSTTKVKIDRTKPVVYSIKNPMDDEWTNQDVTVSGDSRDPRISTGQEGSGIRNMTYYVDKIEKNDWNNSIKNKGIVTFKEQMENEIYLVAYDVAGNKSTLYSAGEVNIDKTPPTFENFSNNGGSNWTKNKVTIKATISDRGGSGLSDAEYNYGNGSANNIDIDDDEYDDDVEGASVVISNTWDYAINTFVNYKIYDEAGNSNEISVGKVMIDRTPPKLTKGRKLNGCDHMILAYTQSDTESGEGYFEYKIENDEWKKWNKDSIKWTQKGKTIKFRAYDAVGNLSNATDGEKIKFADCTPPVSDESGGGSGECGRLLCDGSHVYQECTYADGTKYTWSNGYTCGNKETCKPCDNPIQSGDYKLTTCYHRNGNGVCAPSQSKVWSPAKKNNSSSSGSSTSSGTPHKKGNSSSGTLSGGKFSNICLY